MFLSWIVSFVLLISLMVCRHKHPLNIYLLSAFTITESYMVGTICTFYDSQIVLQAVILTFVVFVALTLFTLQSKMDFSGFGPFLWTTLWVVVFTGFLQMFLPFSTAFDLFMATVTAILFCGTVLFL
jgi:protein lifeguard